MQCVDMERYNKSLSQKKKFEILHDRFIFCFVKLSNIEKENRFGYVCELKRLYKCTLQNCAV